MHILIAPNSFKNSLAAAAAAKAIMQGLEESQLNCTCTSFPVGDGGDGTGELIVQHCNGRIEIAEVHDPLRRKIKASYGLIHEDKTAVIEMAAASGLRLLKADELNPLQATSFGTGELIKHALEKRAEKIILCVGGSATVDGGTGILQALGVRFLDKNKKELVGLPERLIDLDVIDLSGLDKRISDCKLTILCDVENYLLGKEGAANVFGPQKGADPETVLKMEAAMTGWRDVVLRQMNTDMAVIKHGGAAGGVAAGLAALLQAEPVNGIDHFLSLTGFDQHLKKATLVITGEGSIDEQTLQGKAPFGVAKRAKEKNIPVIGLAGKIPEVLSESFQKYFDALFCINETAVDMATALHNTAKNLRRMGKSLGNRLAAGEKLC